MLRPSIAVNTFRPKKKGRPQSNVPGLGPANAAKTASAELENRESALPTLNVIVAAAEPEDGVAERVVVEEGQ